MPWPEHLIALPVLLPLVMGALLLFINERHQRLKFMLNLFSVLGLLSLTVTLLQQVDERGMLAYQAANWAAPFGISLVLDRLSALMLLLVAMIALAALVFSFQRWAKAGVHYHSLFLFLLMGMNGALITGDLFNLFVFFEVMLAASYGLLLHGKNKIRVRAGMSFITLNLVAALFFLIGIAMIYSASGSLNLADLASKSGQLVGVDKALFEAGMAVLAVAFLAKSGIWPLGFWMTSAYAAAVSPVAALLTLVTKMGIYVLYRLWPLVVVDNDSQMVTLGSQVLFWAGIITMLYAALGIFASRDSRRLASYSAMLSSGILVALLGFNHASLTAAALFYLVSSALAVAALMLLLELTDRLYSPIAVTRAAVLKSLDEEDSETEIHGVAIPAALAVLGLSFIGCALVLVGMPPLSGFVAKFGMLVNLFALWGSVSNVQTVIFTLALLLSGGFAIVAFMRLGVRVFWSSQTSTPPKFFLSEASPIVWLLGLCTLLTVFAGPVRGYMDRTGEALNAAPAALVVFSTEQRYE